MDQSEYKKQAANRIYLQKKFADHSICFGCGPANTQGLRIKSMASAESPLDDVIAEWTPSAHHEAFPGMLNGGVIGALLDCHSNWTCAWVLMQKQKLDQPPCTVTADFHVKLLKPTPTNQPLYLVAKALEIKDDRAIIEAKLFCAGKLTAICNGTFVAVKPGHPAYHRW